MNMSSMSNPWNFDICFTESGLGGQIEVFKKTLKGSSPSLPPFFARSLFHCSLCFFARLHWPRAWLSLVLVGRLPDRTVVRDVPREPLHFLVLALSRLQNSRFFLSKSVKRSLRASHARSARASLQILLFDYSRVTWIRKYTEWLESKGFLAF